MSAAEQKIVVRGAREHNLQNVNVTLPRNQMICFTGVSGSGKSSLAFDTLFAEGQRRYLESLSNYARQFVGQLPKPNVDFLSGLSPAISISQKSTGNNPRSTVGTITELHDFLRVLFARVGTGFCPNCDTEITSQTRDQMIERIQSLDSGVTYMFMAPIVRAQKGEHKELFEELRKHGFNRARVDGRIETLATPPTLERHVKHNIELVVDRIAIGQSSRQRVAEAVDLALRFGNGTMLLSVVDESSAPSTNTGRRRRDDLSRSPSSRSEEPEDADQIFSASYTCANCGISYEPPTPQLLSFNSPQGACKVCQGMGEVSSFSEPLLVTDASKSLRNGAIELIGKYSEMPRWLRQSLDGYAKRLQTRFSSNGKSPLSIPWEKLPADIRNAFLYGGISVVGSARRASPRVAAFNGIANELLSTYRNAKNPLLVKQYDRYMTTLPCHECNGMRLNAQARSVKLRSRSAQFKKSPWRNIGDCSRMALNDCCEFFSSLELTDRQQIIAGEAIKEIRSRLQFLLDVGLAYLSLERTAPTLSGGESQRIRLASQIGAGLVGVLYVLDEPSIGLHPRDNDRLLASLQRLRDLGNTLIVVEHDEDTMRSADLIVDFGPGPGVRGGQLIAAGTVEDISNTPSSLTGEFLNRKRTIHRPKERRRNNGHQLRIEGATHHNLKNIDAEIPLGCFVAVTGVSGSGKSSLISDILSPALRNALNKAEDTPGAHRKIVGIEHLDKIIDIDQSPIGRTPRSNPATYVKLFDEIRDLFAELPESKRRGFGPGTFSFNTPEGRCNACEGHGANRLDMEFLADLWVPCPVCNGKRYDRATLQVEFKGKSIADCLELDVQQAMELFEAFPRIVEKLQTLHDVGLDYLKLGQPSPTLSGGEAQRIKLSKELSRRATGRTLYVLDEPTTGLHFHDIDLLLKVLQSLVDLGNTVVVVEHNLDLIQAADWIIDLGPEGGAAGGTIVGQGTPETIAENKRSATGAALQKYFASHRSSQRIKTKKTPTKRLAAKASDDPFALKDLEVVGAQQHNLKNVGLTIARNQMTVFCGQSGSGKTSMAMDTIYAEGQRRFVESLSPYVRQFVGQMPKPIVERVNGLSPSIAIEQRNLSHTPRSTVGTVTETYDYFRVLYARLGQMHCYQCDRPVSTQTADQILDQILALGPADDEPKTPKPKKGVRKKETSNATEAKGSVRALLLAPIQISSTQSAPDVIDGLRKQGFARIRLNGQTYAIDSVPEIQKKARTQLQVVVDRIQISSDERTRISDSVRTALSLGNGVLQIAIADDHRAEMHWDIHTYSLFLACHACGLSFEPLTPHSFSFNTAIGWCDGCQGLGVQTGTDPAASIDDSRTLAQGAMLLWPSLSEPISLAMLHAFCRESGIPIDRPVKQLSHGQRTLLFHGLKNREISVTWGDLAHASNKPVAVQDKDRLYMAFQYQGVYPALARISNLDPSIRHRLWRFLCETSCTTCGGSRVRPEAAHTRFRDKSIADIVQLPLGELLAQCKQWAFNSHEQQVAGELIRELIQRLQFLVDVGLEYLTLDRSANTLSGGEAQRIRLASQLGSGLCGVLYVLDEPTIGLHPRDNDRLIRAMHGLRDLGNTLLVVEHDRDVIASSDRLCDFGPGSGPMGGTVVEHGTPSQIMRSKDSVTGPFLSGKKTIPLPAQRRILVDSQVSHAPMDWKDHVQGSIDWLTVVGAQANTLKNVSVSFPLGCLTAVTGPSGSGKSSLINGILYPALARKLHRAEQQPGRHDRIDGLQAINKVVRVDQSPLGNSPSSNPATYTGVFELIRQWYAKLPEAKKRGLPPSYFSFNVDGGRCEKCEGLGMVRIEMHFLPDVWIQCDACNGRRFTEEILAVQYRGKSISDILSMSIGDVRDLMADVPKLQGMLTTLCDVGLDYLTLGQSAPTLSGGEAQRVKLSAELCRPSTGRTLYLLDEPTTGLHFEDILKLMRVINALVEAGNSVVVIEHNLDVIKCADWVIDMGPEAGKEGGEVVFAGPPEQLVEYVESYPKTQAVRQSNRASVQHRSYTGEALKEVLAREPVPSTQSSPRAPKSKTVSKTPTKAKRHVRSDLN